VVSYNDVSAAKEKAETAVKKLKEYFEELNQNVETLNKGIQADKAKKQYKEIKQSANKLKQEIDNVIKENATPAQEDRDFKRRERTLGRDKDSKNQSFQRLRQRLEKANKDYSAVLGEGGVQEAKEEAGEFVTKLEGANTQLQEAQVPAPAAEAKDAPKPAAKPAAKVAPTTQKPPAKSKPKAKPK
jgi:chromosome segregation ATPase